MSKEYRIATKQITVQHSQANKEVLYFIPFQNQQAFIIFQDIDASSEPTSFVLCDLKNGKVIDQGPFFDEIDKLENLDDDIIVFIDKRDYKLKGYSVIQRKEVPVLGSVNVPSLQALPQATRTEESLDDAIADLSITCFRESKSVVIFEKKQQQLNQLNFVDYLLSVAYFDEKLIQEKYEGTKVQQISVSQNNSTKMIGKLKELNTFIIVPQCVSEAPRSWKLLFWDFLNPLKNTALDNVTLQSSIDGIIVNITPWKQKSEVAFWVNEKQSNSYILIYDYISQTEKEESLKSIEGYKNFLVKNVFDVNFELDRLIINSLHNQYYTSNCLEIVSYDKKAITYSQPIDPSEDSFQFSLDCNYFVSYSQQDEDMGSTPENTFAIHSIIGVKTSLLHFLIQKDILSLYGEEASKAILEMLTESEETKIQNINEDTLNNSNDEALL